MEQIKDIFKNTRLHLGISQFEMAELIGVSRVSISLYETGKATPGSAKLLKVMSIKEKVTQAATKDNN